MIGIRVMTMLLISVAFVICGIAAMLAVARMTIRNETTQPAKREAQSVRHARAA